MKNLRIVPPSQYFLKIPKNYKNSDIFPPQMFLELISTAIFSARKIQVKKITFLPFWAVFAQNLGNFGKIFQKKFAPIFFSSFRTTGENFSQNGDPHVTPMVQSLIHPLLISNIHSMKEEYYTPKCYSDIIKHNFQSYQYFCT